MAEGANKRQSDQRFRSFAERFLVTRSSLFSTDPDQLAKDTWECIQNARRAYMMIKAVGYGRFEDTDDGHEQF